MRGAAAAAFCCCRCSPNFLPLPPKKLLVPPERLLLPPRKLLMPPGEAVGASGDCIMVVLPDEGCAMMQSLVWEDDHLRPSSAACPGRSQWGVGSRPSPRPSPHGAAPQFWGPGKPWTTGFTRDQGEKPAEKRGGRVREKRRKERRVPIAELRLLRSSCWLHEKSLATGDNFIGVVSRGSKLPNRTPHHVNARTDIPAPCPPRPLLASLPRPHHRIFR